MNTIRALAVGVGITAALGSVASAAGPGVLGYLDPKAGTFKPLVSAAPLAGGGSSTGRIYLALNIAVQTTIPTTAAISCTVTATVVTTTARVIVDSASIKATRNSAGAATCVLSMYYQWPGVTTGDTLSLSYDVLAVDTTTLVPYRDSLVPFSSGPVPPSGSTTSHTLGIVL